MMRVYGSIRSAALHLHPCASGSNRSRVCGKTSCAPLRRMQRNLPAHAGAGHERRPGAGHGERRCATKVRLRDLHGRDRSVVASRSEVSPRRHTPRLHSHRAASRRAHLRVDRRRVAVPRLSKSVASASGGRPSGWCFPGAMPTSRRMKARRSRSNSPPRPTARRLRSRTADGARCVTDIPPAMAWWVQNSAA